MLRLLAFLAVLGLAAWGLSWLDDNPGDVTLVWRGETHTVSLMQALGLVSALVLALSLVFGLLRFLLRTPELVAQATRARRREKGFAALSAGMVAVGAGETRQAQALAYEADRYFGDEPLTKLLRAQTAQLAGDRAGAVAAFHDMLASEETHLLGLRGLHVEARRAGDAQAAVEYARRANARAGAPWAAQAVLDDYASRGDWANALATVEANAKAGLIDRPTSARWRAVLKTALAEERAERDPRGALALAREALELAPNLVPAAALSAKLAAGAGDLRRAAKLLEAAYAATPHPDLAEGFVRLRPGDSAADRLVRARALARVAPDDPESLLVVARSALETQDLAAAREALAPMLHGAVRPTARVCLLMAEIEEAAGDDGGVREWLARAARAPRDRAWIAPGLVADRWAPAGPDGALDVFVWRSPPERSGGEPALVWTPAPRPPTPRAVSPPEPPAPPAVAAPVPTRRLGAPAPVLIANAPDDPGPQARSQTGKPLGFRKFAVE